MKQLNFANGEFDISEVRIGRVVHYNNAHDENFAYGHITGFDTEFYSLYKGKYEVSTFKISVKWSADQISNHSPSELELL